MQKSKDSSVTANGTTHTTEEARVNVCDIDMFVQVQFLKESPAVRSVHRVKKTITRMNGIQGSHPHLIKNWKNIDCTTDNFFPLVVSCVQATEHQTTALGDVKLTPAVADHGRNVDTEIPKELQPCTEGLTRGSSSSTDVSQVDVATSLPSILLSAHPKLCSKTSGEKHNLFIHFPQRPELRSLQTHESYEAALQNESWRSGGPKSDCRDIWRHENSRPHSSQCRPRIKTATQTCSGLARCGDAMDSELSMQDQISSSDADKCQPCLAFRRKPQIHFCTQFCGIEGLNWNHGMYAAQIRNTWNCRASCTTIEKGISSVLVQSGLQERWLAEDMECNCYLRNIQDLLADVQTL